MNKTKEPNSFSQFLGPRPAYFMAHNKELNVALVGSGIAELVPRWWPETGAAASPALTTH